MSMADALTEWRNKALELATAYTCAAIDKVTLWDICQSQEKPGLEQVERDAWTALVAHINGSPADAPAYESCPGCKAKADAAWNKSSFDAAQLYEEAMVASNEAGCVGMTAAETIRYLSAELESARPHGVTPCPRCGGRGSYTSDYHTTIQCPRCNGTGRAADGAEGRS
jgi:hypothetical protein